MLFQDNLLRYFQNDELYHGLKRIELMSTQQIQEVIESINLSFVNRTKSGINETFKFITDYNTNEFSLSLLERMMINDKSYYRYKRLKAHKLILDLRNLIGYNLNMESIIQYRLNQDPPDYPTIRIFLNEILLHDQYYQEDKEAHLMRLLPFILNK